MGRGTGRAWSLVLALVLVAALCPAIPFGVASSQQGAARQVVYVISVTGSIETGLAEYVRRGIAEASEAGSSAVLFEIDTFGGRVDAATDIRDLVLGSSLPSIAFVKGRAWSAGALIALAAESIVMAPGASIGAAETVPKSEKEISALRGEFEATAQARGRSPEVAAAMVDADVAVEGLVEAGKLLTLTARRARGIGFIDHIAEDRGQALAACGLADARIVQVAQSWAEKVARFVTEPLVSSMLLIMGFLGLLFEVTTPGWGVPGTCGAVALALFFGGRMIAGLAGWEAPALFVLGSLLLLVEVFLIPGFGVAGVGGIVAIFTALALSFRDLREAAYVLSFSVVAVAFIVGVASKYLGRSVIFGRLVLRASETQAEGYTVTGDRQAHVGRVGTALTAMRPSGTILLDGARLDAVTEGDYVPKGSAVQVIEVKGPRLVVRGHEEHLG